MPVAGRKPKDGEKRNRVKPVHDWTEVPDVPYDGPVPDLPTRRTFTTKGGTTQLAMVVATKRWWESVTSMPHCVLWSQSDWQFALTTAFVADDVFRGDTGKAAELRQREKVLGTTMDSRRDLRIRYVEEPVDGGEGSERADASGGKSNVTSLERRRRQQLLDDDAS